MKEEYLVFAFRAIFLSALLGLATTSKAEEVYAVNMTCTSEEEAFTIPLNNITHIMMGKNGYANCIAGVDTTGQARIICDTPDNPFICKFAEEVEL